MNEKIKELAQQAQDNGDAIHYYDPIFAEKFAELIVRECSNRSAELGNPELGQGLLNHFGLDK